MIRDQIHQNHCPQGEFNLVIMDDDGDQNKNSAVLQLKEYLIEIGFSKV